MAAWLLWLVAAGLLLVVETLSLDLVFAMIAGGALAAALTAGVGGGATLQIIAFGAASIGLLVGARPIAKRHLLDAPNHLMGIEALVGRAAVVVEPVDDRHGRVKIDGEVWSATSYVESETLAVGSTVQVMEIRGATAIVWGGV